MNLDTFHNYQLELMSHLQAIRNPALDHLITPLNNFDTWVFYYLLIIVVWYAYSPKWGVELLSLFIVSAIINSDAKELFTLPRPFHLKPDFAVITVESYGFPSGAAQMATTIFGFLALKIQKKMFWVCTILFILIVSFSRIYLGVHFPTDILGGWAIGGALAYGAYLTFPSLEPYLAKQSKGRLLFISVMAFAVLSLVSMSPDGIIKAFLGLGTSIGLIYAPTIAQPNTFSQKSVRTLTALFGVFFLSRLSSYIESYIASGTLVNSMKDITQFLVGLLLSYGIVVLYSKFSPAHKKQKV